MNMMQIMLYSTDAEDLDFYIKGIFSYKLFGHTLWITTTHLTMLIVTIVLIVLGIVVNRMMRHPKEVPTGFQNAIEYGYEFIEKTIHQNMKSGDGFINYIGTVALFVLLANLSGLVGLRSATADYGVTFAIGIITFFLIHITGIRCKKMGHFKELFEPVPILFPINLIGEVAVPISLSMRLFANMLGGTIIIALWYGLMPLIANLAIPAFLHAYLDLFSGAIQAYVLCMLTMVYIDNKM